MADARIQYPFDLEILDILITGCPPQRHQPTSVIQRMTCGQYNDFGGK
jgi:coenzyme F420-reducing hydrogenase gamma subunit